MSPQQLAGTSGQSLLDRAESLRILAKLQDGGAQLVTPANPPTSPSSPKVKRNTALGLLLGFLLGLTAAFLLERLDRRMKNPEDLEEAYQLPLLAAVPQSKAYAAAPKLGATNAHAESEVFKLLRAYLRYFNVDRELRTLLVVSSAPGDGKTTIAQTSLRLRRRPVVKPCSSKPICADPRSPRITTSIPLPAFPNFWLAR